MTHSVSLPKARRCLATLASSLAVALALAAAPACAAPKTAEIGVDGSVSVEEGFTDNVRGDRLNPASAWYTQFQTLAEWTRGGGWLPHRVGGIARSRVYSSYPNRNFSEFGIGFGYDWDSVSATVDYLYSPDRLRVDPATEVDAFADGHELQGELRTRFGKKKRWTALAGFQFEADFYDASFRERSFYEETAEAGLRFRATEWLSPRASFAYSWRDAISSNYDREDAGLRVGFDVHLPAAIRGTFRYEKTWRNFIVGFERDAEGRRNNNFGREDDAHEIEAGLGAPVPWIDSTFVHLDYRHYENDSTRLERSYDVNEARLRFSYVF